MLDLDHEFDQSFDTNPAPEPTSKAAQPAFSPSDKAGQPAANPSAKAGPPGSKPAAWPLPPASSPTASSPPVAPIPPITAASINAINSALNNAPKGPVTHQDLGKDARSLAESAYQRIADEILESTREVCQRLISDGEKALERAKFLEGETAQKHEEAQKELEAAKALRAEAEAFREKSLAAVSEAQKQAQEILDRARTETDAQLSQVKQQASAEAEKLAD
ncbi:MAG TPA: hypothetical protein VI855_01945, partial [Dehalococcoidia bacterium]|nr:hypothetical protein [Dehalococcoidia bacterium]